MLFLIAEKIPVVYAVLCSPLVAGLCELHIETEMHMQGSCCLLETAASSFMALMGMGANMQYNDHFPGHYSMKGLIFGAEGSSWTSSNMGLL
ncbi:hypothetical protein AHAS_Ahas08G0172000 [Arachis hypogaea]